VRWLICPPQGTRIWNFKTVAKLWENSHSAFAPGELLILHISRRLQVFSIRFSWPRQIESYLPCGQIEVMQLPWMHPKVMGTRPTICISVSSSHSSDYLQCNQSIVCLFIEFGSLFVYLILVCKMELSVVRTSIDHGKCRMPDCLHNCVLNACVSLCATKQTTALRKKQRRFDGKTIGAVGGRIAFKSMWQFPPTFNPHPFSYRQWARIILSVSRQPTTSKNNNNRYSKDPVFK